MTCRRCHLIGHLERFCKETQEQGGAHAAIQQEEDRLFVVLHVPSLQMSWTPLNMLTKEQEASNLQLSEAIWKATYPKMCNAFFSTMFLESLNTRDKISRKEPK